MLKINNYMVLNEVLYQGDFSDYMDAAQDLADKHNVPVLVAMPYYDRNYLVFPKKITVPKEVKDDQKP